MAIEFIAWALKQELPTGPKFVLVALANRADEEGECWPSYKDIIKQTGISKRSITNYMAILEERGFIERSERRREDGYKTSNSYKIIKNEVAEFSGAKSAPKPKTSGAKSARSQVHHVQDNISPYGDIETSLEPSGFFEEKSSLPPWLPQDVWDSFCKYKGSGFKQQSKNLTIRKLAEWKKQGHDPTEILETTIRNGWQGLFEPKTKGKTNENTKSYQQRVNDSLSEAIAQLEGSEGMGTNGSPYAIEGPCTAKL